MNQVPETTIPSAISGGKPLQFSCDGTNISIKEFGPTSGPAILVDASQARPLEGLIDQAID